MSILLADFCEIVQGGRLGLSGSDFVPQGFPAFGAGGVNGYLAVSEFDEPAVVLSAIGARCGKCFLAGGKWTSLANTQLIFPDPKRADCRFLWYQLNDERRWHRSGTGQPFIKPSDVKAHGVFLPPLPDQRRIADILDKAEALRAKRHTALAELDPLTQSIFVEMFGDPATNPRGFETSNIGEVSEKVTDGEHLTPKREKTGIKLLSARNIRDGYIDLSVVDYIGIKEHERIKQRCDPSPGDILISCSGTIGRVTGVQTSEPFSLVRSVAMVRPRSSLVRPKFLEHYLRTPTLKRRMQRRANASSQANLFQNQIRELPVMVPPLELQDTFAGREHGVNRVRGDYLASLVEFDALVASLQHRAFSGQL